MDIESAFGRYHPVLFRYLHRLTGDSDLAQDLAQESFVRLVDHRQDVENVKSWLFAVATNLLRDRSRTRSRRRELLDVERPGPGAPERPDESLERSRRRAAVRAALGRLGDRDREMLLMRQEGFRYAEIAEAAGVATSSVGTLLARALERFEEAYAETAAGPAVREGETEA